MKVRIEAEPGELEEKSDELIHLVSRLSSKLSKAAPKPNEQIKQSQLQIEYPVIQGSMKRATRQVNRIHKLMDQKIAAVLDEVK